ncbi:MAG: hypothetical protein M3Q65_02005 [Chloroflexota bacterium]|nr:hypothetical protein [Chloroflexota bacterium]
MDLRRGDVVFFRAGDSPIDRAILAASLSRIVHVGISLDDRYYVEAVWPRARVASSAAALPWAVTSPTWPDAGAADRAADAAILQIGQRYDLAGVTTFGAGLVFPTWRDRLAATVGEAQEILRLQAAWCSELVAAALLAGGIALPVPPERCAPVDLARLLGVGEPG